MINRVTLLGYVGNDPEIRSFESGSKMARVRIATTENIYIRKSNVTKQHTEWHTVTFWGETANFIDKYVRKGAQLYIEGALRHREWNNKEGVQQTTIDIVGNELKVVNQPKIESRNHIVENSSPTTIIPPKDDCDEIPF